MFSDSPTATPSVAHPGGESASTALHLLEFAFREWVNSDAKPEVLIVGPGNETAVPLEEALGHLRRSTEALAPACGQLLGLGSEASIAAAAESLLRACTDPDGPRCRSFRSATYYLSGAARIKASELFDNPRTRAVSVAAGAARAPIPT